MLLHDLFEDQVNEQMPGALRRMATGIKAMAGNPRAAGERQIVRIARDLTNKAQRWAGTVGGLTVEHLRDYPPYKLDPDFQDTVSKLEVTFGPTAEIDDDSFEDAMLEYVRERARKATPMKTAQATRGITPRVVEILQDLNDAQLQAWINKAKKDKVDDSNPVLVAAEAELARRGGGTQASLPLGTGGASAAGTAAPIGTGPSPYSLTP